MAVAVLAALDNNRQRAPFSSLPQAPSPRDAYAVTAELRRLRTGRGELQLGRKIGFTNRNIWPEYGVFEPIWGDIYDTTVRTVAPGDRIAVMQLPQPRIEPEIVFGLRADLRGEVGLADIVDALDWVAHGFEVVQSIFPGWIFSTADTIANCGLHGALFIGPKRDIAASERTKLAAELSALRVSLHRNGEVVDRGVGANVLDGPVEALSHLVKVLEKDRLNPPLRAGEIVTTGTLTRAFPVEPGERWSTVLDGAGLPGLEVEIG